MTVKAASFDDFLNAPTRLGSMPPKTKKKTKSPRISKKAKPVKEKVGLTLDSSLIDAIDDYIYTERKKGNRLKKNEVYEAALRQFLGLD